jgi:hypothetical protein
MMVIGYRPNANFAEAQNVLQKHTAFSVRDIKNMLDHIREGQGVKLPNDFVLREDLTDLNFLVD